MGSTELDAWPDDDTLWDGLNVRLRATIGIVGVSKMLNSRNDDAARQVWLARVRPVLDALGSLVPLTASEDGVVVASDGVDLRFNIHDVVIRVDDEPRWLTMILIEPAAIAVAAIGRARWGGEWLAALGSPPSSRPIAPTDGYSTDVDVFPWVAQNPGGPAPWTTAATEADAELAAIVEVLGLERVSELFQEFTEGRR